MKVFIIWSGEKSKAVAFKLHQLISDMIQAVKPFLSLEDLDAGARWNEEIAKELSETKFGIICLTKSNTEVPWILFEAGAVAKTVDHKTFVCPYLIDMGHSDIPKGPLTQFQWKRANEEGTQKLIETINGALGEAALSDDRLKRTFDKFWPDLNKVLQDLPEEDSTEEDKRSKEEMTEEILDVVRSMSRRTTSTTVPPSVRTGLGERPLGLASYLGEGDNSTTTSLQTAVGDNAKIRKIVKAILKELDAKKNQKPTKINED
jgi:hypothetical protein